MFLFIFVFVNLYVWHSFGLLYIAMQVLVSFGCWKFLFCYFLTYHICYSWTVLIKHFWRNRIFKMSIHRVLHFAVLNFSFHRCSIKEVNVETLLFLGKNFPCPSRLLEPCSYVLIIFCQKTCLLYTMFKGWGFLSWKINLI